MRILIAHNYYQQPGGEDVEFRQEVELLRAHGHDVHEYVEDNRRIPAMAPLSLALQTIWSWTSYRALASKLKSVRPDVVHFHNTFPLISPSAYYASRATGVPVIQSLYNPRLMCPAASFYRDGRLCTDCLARLPWPGVVHACYHGSRTQTLVITKMITVHRLLATWNRLVDRFLVATDFYRQLYMRGGLKPGKIVIKPNFVASDPGQSGGAADGEYALFVGRLEPQKGVPTLLRAWRQLDIPLLIRGSGQLEQETRQYIEAHALRHVRMIDRLSAQELAGYMRRARFLVWPSEGYYETFGLVAAESYAAGVPVVASRIGIMNEIVLDQETGLHFTAGDAEDLANKSRWLWQNPRESIRMGVNARREYEQKYTPDRNYESLMRIYSDVTAGRSS